ncbi:hypothetical protein [Pseudomonas sp. YuFO20]
MLPEIRRAGIGRRLLQAVIEAVETLDVRSLDSVVNARIHEGALL